MAIGRNVPIMKLDFYLLTLFVLGPNVFLGTFLLSILYIDSELTYFKMLFWTMNYSTSL
jgi:hypothetical protein